MDSCLNDLLWIEELLPHDILMLPKYGGQTYFLDEHMVLILVELPAAVYDHKGVTYPFNLWHGCIFPIEQIKQNAFIRKYLFLENHPVNKDWLYIPSDSENFEEEVKLLLREIARRNILLGIPIKTRKKKKVTSVTGPSSTKPAPKKEVKADKKKENNFILSMVKKVK